MGGHEAPSIFLYSEPKAYLGAVFEAKRKKNESFSVRAWARQLGYRSPSLLLNVLKGERRPGPGLVSRLEKALGLARREQKYFELLMLVARARTPAERERYAALLEAMRPPENRAEMKLTQFKLIFEWYPLAVLELLSLRDFRADPEFLARRLRGKVSPPQIAGALRRLRRLDLLAVDAGGKLRRGAGNPILKDEVPSEAIRNHHREMMQRAREALREQSIDERDFRVTKFALKKENYETAKRLIKECHQALQKLSTAEAADEVYALNTQLFRLTRPVAS